ncbi:ionic transporter y4hA [uncultured Phenylobacterium sp.]|uniref:calcium:proton antiporter n=1 Tax=uncultured Phenylobacterium sp. TaxID=349273 RepID=UPI0025F439AD|nr:ionic transporter y4hA [uncultured Phenylobacterium sp.]
MSFIKALIRAPLWSIALPVVALLLLAFVPAEGVGALALFAALVGAVFAAVHHAEVVAHKVGEPFGTLVLAASVTVIESALIISIMLSEPGGNPTLARDTLFATVMIVLHGIVGLCVIVGGLRHGAQGFQAPGATAFLSVLATTATLTLILPVFTTTAQGPVFTASQLLFVSAASLILYGVFLFVQTVGHRDFFLPAATPENEELHAAPPSNRLTAVSGLFLLVGLGAVVLLAKSLSYPIEAAIRGLGVAHPAALVGAIVATLVLLPEGMAAVAAARRNRLQTSLNLALGSGLASISLTIPAVAAVAVLLGEPLVLGLGPKEMVMLALSFVVSALTLAGGRTTVLHGAIHLVIFAVFAYLLVVP